MRIFLSIEHGYFDLKKCFYHFLTFLPFQNFRQKVCLNSNSPIFSFFLSPGPQSLILWMIIGKKGRTHIFHLSRKSLIQIYTEFYVFFFFFFFLGGGGKKKKAEFYQKSSGNSHSRLETIKPYLSGNQGSFEIRKLRVFDCSENNRPLRKNLF